MRRASKNENGGRSDAARRLMPAMRHFTVKLNVIDCVTSLVPVTAPVGDAVAVIVIVDVPLGVGNEDELPPPQEETPVSEPATSNPAAHRIHSRRLARRLLAIPNRPSPSRRPVHQKMPVGVMTGAWSTSTLSELESTGT